MTRKGEWVLEESRFLTGDEIGALRGCTLERAKASRWRRRSTVLEWITVEVALHTGLRVSEIAGLCCGDIWLGSRRGSLLVRNGKGGRRRAVKFGSELRRALGKYLAWKATRGEPTGSGAPLIRSSHTGGHVTTRALQKMFARVCARAGIEGHRFHDTRHTYASYLYRASGNNLRLVQKQLGHASVRTTEVYADVLDGEAERAVEALYG